MNEYNLVWNELVGFFEFWCPNGKDDTYEITVDDFCRLTRCMHDEYSRNIEAIVEELKDKVKFIKYENEILYVQVEKNACIEHKDSVTIVIN